MIHSLCDYFDFERTTYKEFLFFLEPTVGNLVMLARRFKGPENAMRCPNG